MKKFLKIFISLIILGAIWYQFRAKLNFFSAPCAEPIPYELGSFDSRFDISENYFLNALQEAEMIWEKPFGKELFVYRANGKKDKMLKINLVYDYRQQATNKLASLGIIVKDNRVSYDMLKIKFTELKTEFVAAKSSYDAQVQSFNDRKKVYEKRVEYWNAQGGAPREVYEELQLEKSALDMQVSELQREQMQMNEMVDEINALVVALNRLANTLNLSVEKYNTIGASRGESFEEGVYSSDGSSKEIDIYEFSSREKLIRVLTHELGHALGLDHVEDPKAIMYKLNQGNTKTLTQTDFEMLKTKCQEK